MIIKIKNLPERETQLQFEEKAQKFPYLAEMMENGECSFSSPLRISLFIEPVSGMYRVEGRLNFSVCLNCSKCLDKFEVLLSDNFAFTYTRQEEDLNQNEAELKLSAQEMGFIHFSGEEIDLREAIQEQALFTLPMHPRCSESCKGLCPECGANLNKNPCRCSRPKVDERFTVLKSLKLNNITTNNEQQK